MPNKRQKKFYSIEFLPNDILFEILSLAIYKDLYSTRVIYNVCKSWRQCLNSKLQKNYPYFSLSENYKFAPYVINGQNFAIFKNIEYELFRTSMNKLKRQFFTNTLSIKTTQNSLEIMSMECSLNSILHQKMTFISACFKIGQNENQFEFIHFLPQIKSKVVILHQISGYFLIIVISKNNFYKIPIQRYVTGEDRSHQKGDLITMQPFLQNTLEFSIIIEKDDLKDLKKFLLSIHPTGIIGIKISNNAMELICNSTSYMRERLCGRNIMSFGKGNLNNCQEHFYFSKYLCNWNNYISSIQKIYESNNTLKNNYHFDNVLFGKQRDSSVLFSIIESSFLISTFVLSYVSKI